MDSLITVMNKLQDVFSTIGTSQIIHLPQIVVVGSQSSGKSSVLESLVGKSFLPRGTGIVTRSPLVLHFINASNFENGPNSLSKQSDTWATFLHKPEEIFRDFNKVRKEIEQRTEELAGNKKNITEEQIVLNIYSTHLYNISFVDLPGLTKVPVGDQPQDIENKIKNLVLKFIKNPNSIILAVVTANTDPATSESLHIAKSVDPAGDRTIAVVTKIDIMDAGTDATELLSGNVIPVKLGIIGVINRSQKDINENKTIADSLIAEKRFFQRMYSSIADNHGTIILGKRLQTLLIQKIKETYPSLKQQVYEMHNKYAIQVKQIKEFTNNYDRSLLEIIIQTASSYNACLDGNANTLELNEPNSGSKISKYFKTVFNKDMDDIKPLKKLTTDTIINIINNAAGISIGTFMPARAFDNLVKIELKLLESPSLRCVHYVHEELILNLFRLDADINSKLKKYPNLMDKILEVLQDSLAKYKQKAIKSVNKLMRYQEAFINTAHPDFIHAVVNSQKYHQFFDDTTKEDESNESLIDLEDLNSDQNLNTNTESDLKNAIHQTQKNVDKICITPLFGFFNTEKYISKNRIRLLVLFTKCYFHVIKKIIQDTVPKAIMHEMVNNIKQNFQKDLITKVYKSNQGLKIEELLLESPEVIKERTKIYDNFNAAEKALKLMREIEQRCQ